MLGLGSCHSVGCGRTVAFSVLVKNGGRYKGSGHADDAASDRSSARCGYEGCLPLGHTIMLEGQRWSGARGWRFGDALMRLFVRRHVGWTWCPLDSGRTLSWAVLLYEFLQGPNMWPFPGQLLPQWNGVFTVRVNFDLRLLRMLRCVELIFPDGHRALVGVMMNWVV